MSDTVIKVEDVSKKYFLAHQAQGIGRYERFGDVLIKAATAPFRIFRRKKETSPTREEFWALKDLSFEVKRGDVVGILGRNGAGKSTLLKILSRITEPTSGRVEIDGRVASLLEVGTGFHAELTGRENIFLNGAVLGMSRVEIRKKFDEIVAFAEVEKFLDTPVKHYSSGMYVRLAFAIAAHLEPEILIVDEVLAVGDAQFQKKCLGKMQDVSTKEGRTVLFVSHNMGAVSNLCNRGIVLQKGKVVFQGPTERAIETYHEASYRSDEKMDPSVLYAAPPTPGQVGITKIAMFDLNGRPKALLSTWDDVVFRITFESNRKLVRGGVEIHVSSLSGGKLFLLSNQPDGTFPIDFENGENSIDCMVKKFPLSAGEYIIGAALAIASVEYIWKDFELASFTVHPRDVFGSGLAPTASRALIAPDYGWMDCRKVT